MSGVSSARESFVDTVLPAVDLVHNLSRRLVRPPSEAEDLAQDTLARAWEAWARGVRPDSVRPWLSTICLNLARDRARRAVRRPEVEWRDGLDPVDPLDVEGEALTRVQRGLVDRAMATLPEPQRVAIVLMDICGLTAAEVATITDSPRGTVLSRVHRGRKALVLAVHSRARDHDNDAGGDVPGRRLQPGPGRSSPGSPKSSSDPNDDKGGPQR